MGIFGRDVTVVVDVANVMGSRPDGWWRDRAGAAIRLHDQIVRLAASGRAILPPPGGRPPADAPDPAGGPPGPAGDAPDPPGDHPGSPGEQAPAFVLVLEGAARAAVSRLPSARPAGDDTATATGAVGTGAGPARPGEVRVVEARGSGDDAIVAVVRELPGRRVVVTADRELRARCVAAGAEILGPGWLLGQL
jgi:8-oxo-dGTP diphosphatase